MLDIRIASMSTVPLRILTNLKTSNIQECVHRNERFCYVVMKGLDVVLKHIVIHFIQSTSYTFRPWLMKTKLFYSKTIIL